MNARVTITLADEDQASLEGITAGRAVFVEQALETVVKDALAHDRWFRAGVQKGLDDLAAGRAVSHEEICSELDALLASYEAPAGA